MRGFPRSASRAGPSEEAQVRRRGGKDRGVALVTSAGATGEGTPGEGLLRVPGKQAWVGREPGDPLLAAPATHVRSPPPASPPPSEAGPAPLKCLSHRRGPLWRLAHLKSWRLRTHYKARRRLPAISTKVGSDGSRVCKLSPTPSLEICRPLEALKSHLSAPFSRQRYFVWLCASLSPSAGLGPPSWLLFALSRARWVVLFC